MSSSVLSFLGWTSVERVVFASKGFSFCRKNKTCMSIVTTKIKMRYCCSRRMKTNAEGGQEDESFSDGV